MKRKEILDEAARLTTTDREKEYGSPLDNYTAVAALWTAYCNARGVAYHEQTGTKARVDFGPENVLVMMSLLKIARTATGQPKADNYLDGAGYLALAGEIATE